MKKAIHYALLGIPDDLAVRAVNGRPGAKKGPLAFRQYFGKLVGEFPVSASVTDLGDVKGLETSDAAKHHELAIDAVKRACDSFDGVIVIGGSHDHGHSHLAGHLGKLKKLACINVDAHLDVRSADGSKGEKISSGSPFWLALENGVLKPERFVEFGIQDHCNSKPLWDYVRAKKVRVVPWTELRGKVIGKTWAAELSKLASKSDGVVVSFDLDAIASVYAPGVSAPQAEGLTSSDAIEMCEIAGKHPAVKSLGLFELNPDFDQDGRTARLAATMAWHFLAAKMGGLSNSGGGKSKK